MAIFCLGEGHGARLPLLRRAYKSYSSSKTIGGTELCACVSSETSSRSEPLPTPVQKLLCRFGLFSKGGHMAVAHHQLSQHHVARDDIVLFLGESLREVFGAAGPFLEVFPAGRLS